MAIRIIRTDDDPVLREKSIPVKNFNNNLARLLDDMAETMYDANGVGLAAPQIGISKRVVVIDIDEGLHEIINPEILETRDEQTGPEGCLSVPGLTGIVCRPNYVKIKAQDRHGEEFILEGEELMARAILHEIDHLNGVIFTDLADEVYRTEEENATLVGGK